MKPSPLSTICAIAATVSLGVAAAQSAPLTQFDLGDAGGAYAGPPKPLGADTTQVYTSALRTTTSAITAEDDWESLRMAGPFIKGFDQLVETSGGDPTPAYTSALRASNTNITAEDDWEGPVAFVPTRGGDTTRVHTSALKASTTNYTRPESVIVLSLRATSSDKTDAGLVQTTGGETTQVSTSGLSAVRAGNVAAVPEPTSALLIGSGLIGTIGLFRRAKRTQT